MTGNVFLRRVVLSNYRSIGYANVRLGPLTYLIGRNGAGKSNFLDALRLVNESLSGSLEQALRERGGINEVRRRSGGHPTHFGLRLEMNLSRGVTAMYAFKVGARPDGAFGVEREECFVSHGALKASHYVVQHGEVQDNGMTMPPAVDDRLYLVNAAGLPQFRPVFDALSHIGVYNINPELMRQLQAPDRGDVLKRDGRNLSSVLAQLDRPEFADRKQRIVDFLERVVPGLSGVHRRAVGHMETIEFRQRVEGQAQPWRFPAINMSDGTLRALGVLVALFQPGFAGRMSLVGLEEPETALHPAAASVLRECISETASHVQVVVTSHSGDMLDDASISEEMLRAVEAIDGRTEITSIDPASRSALRDRLYSAGELLRAGQLAIDPAEVSDGRQLDLFESLDA
jgi:predicted ATPase